MAYLLEVYRILLRRGCRLMIQSRTVYHYRSCCDDRAVTQRIREIAETHVRYGIQRIHILLRCEGWLINHKKPHRIYCQERLNVRTKRPWSHVTVRHRCSWPEVSKTDSAGAWISLLVICSTYRTYPSKAQSMCCRERFYNPFGELPPRLYTL